MVAALLLITVILTGIWYFSYAKYYYQLTETMDQTTKEDKVFTSSDYTTEKNGYRFEVWLPIILSNSGFVRVMDDDGLVMFGSLRKETVSLLVILAMPVITGQAKETK